MMEKEISFTRTRRSQTSTNMNVLASQLMARQALANVLGVQFSGARKLYTALGYKTNLFYADYVAKYERQDIAKAVIDRPVNATWQGGVSLIETDDAKESAFEKEWNDLKKNLDLIDKFIRVDKLVGIGEYAVLLLGFDDASNREQFATEVKSGKRKLEYIMPFGQESAKISTYETRPNNPRYGKPLYYDVSVVNVIDNSSIILKVHYTRIIHIVEDVLESDVKGIPKLQSIYNRLDDLEKIVGGDGEMFWKGALPGYAGKIDADHMLTPEGKDDLDDQIKEYENGLKRILINEGLDLQSLAQQIADPSKHVDVQIQMISAVTGIPKRILTGSERGELSSAQDASEWNVFVHSRRQRHVEPHVLKPFIEACVKYKVLSEPKNGFEYKWLDLFAVSEKERAEIGRMRATAIKEYFSMPLAETRIPPKAFMRFCLGLSDTEIKLVETMVAEEYSEEDMAKALAEALAAQTKPKPEQTQQTQQ